MNQLAVIHIAKKELGLEDDAYRAMLSRVAGKTSSRDMTDAERRRVIDEMHRLGWKPQQRRKIGSKDQKQRLEGKYAPKLQALWISAWHLGVVRDNSDAALLKYVKRQTGLDHTRFLHYPDDARKAIEALKKWLEREGGVDWRLSVIDPVWMQTDASRVAAALVRKADALGLFTMRLGYAARLETIAERHPAAFTSREWITVHKHLGERIRKALRKNSEAGG